MSRRGCRGRDMMGGSASVEKVMGAVPGYDIDDVNHLVCTTTTCLVGDQAKS